MVTAEPLPGPGYHRHRRTTRRGHRFNVTYDDAETAEITAAAARAGLTPTGYIASAALAAATSTRPPVHSPARETLLALMAASTQLRRLAGNVNQAVAALNATGQAPVWLHAALRTTMAAVARVDAAAERAAERLP